MTEVFSMKSVAGKAGEALKDHNLYSELNLSMRNALLQRFWRVDKSSARTFCQICWPSCRYILKRIRVIVEIPQPKDFLSVLFQMSSSTDISGLSRYSESGHGGNRWK